MSPRDDEQYRPLLSSHRPYQEYDDASEYGEDSLDIISQDEASYQGPEPLHAGQSRWLMIRWLTRVCQAITNRVAFLQPQEQRSPLEQDLVRRLDIFLLTFGCISQVIKYLDQTNISSAYVSGMKEDLGLFGDELNYFTTYFSISYCLMLIPSQIIITHMRPSYWLPGLEIGWGFITGLIALTQNASQVYVLRVFLGLFESSAWPGMMTLFMYWYTPIELAKRMGFYHSCQALGQMMSGALQVATLETLDGTFGLKGWRWLFVINGIITLFVGLAGFIMIPDYPSNPNPRAVWLSDQHTKMAAERLDRHGRADAKRIGWASAKRTFSMGVAYLIPALYIATVLAPYGYNYFNLFLKSLTNPDGSPRWTTEEVNSIPIAGGALNVLFVWIWAILSDLFQTRWTLLIAQAVIGLIPCIIMSVWTANSENTSITSAYASYFMLYLSLGTAPLIMSWLSDLLPQDPEARTLIVGYSIAGVYAILSWSQVLIWPASQAPYYKFAWQLSIVFWIMVVALTCSLHIMDRQRWFRTSRSDAISVPSGQQPLEEESEGAAFAEDAAPRRRCTCEDQVPGTRQLCIDCPSIFRPTISPSSMGTISSGPRIDPNAWDI